MSWINILCWQPCFSSFTLCPSPPYSTPSAQGDWPNWTVPMGSLSSLQLLCFLEAPAEDQRVEGEWGDSIHSLLSSGWLLWADCASSSENRSCLGASAYSCSSQGPVTASSICPFRPSGVCCSSLLPAQGTSLSLVSLNLVHAFVNSPFIKSLQITPFKCAICVSSQTPIGTELTTKYIYIFTCFSPLIFHHQFLQPESILFSSQCSGFSFQKRQFYFVMGKFMLFFCITQKYTSEKL